MGVFVFAVAVLGAAWGIIVSALAWGWDNTAEAFLVGGVLVAAGALAAGALISWPLIKTRMPGYNRR